MDIGKSKDNFDKDRKPRCFNCNIYGYMAKKCQRSKRKRNTRKCYKYDKVEYLARDYRTGQKIKNRSIEKNSNEETNNKQESFVGGLEQA